MVLELHNCFPEVKNEKQMINRLMCKLYIHLYILCHTHYTDIKLRYIDSEVLILCCLLLRSLVSSSCKQNKHNNTGRYQCSALLPAFLVVLVFIVLARKITCLTA